MTDPSSSSGPAMVQASLDTMHTPVTIHAHIPRPASIENALALQAAQATFSPLCPSARTSYTRVDFSGANTPRGDFIGIDDHDEDDEDDENAARVGEREADDGALQVPEIPQTPQVSLTFLLVNGRRRTMSFDPETTVGRVKELVWNAWPNDWQDERPPAPSYLRILYLGKILQDEDSLDKVSFPTSVPSSSPASTIVHLSIRAYAPQAEDMPKKKRRGGNAASDGPTGDADEQAGCCSACIIC